MIDVDGYRDIWIEDLELDRAVQVLQRNGFDVMKRNVEEKAVVNNCSNFTCYNYSWNLNLFSGPKATITCWKCSNNFEHRIPRHSYPVVSCSVCSASNRIPLVFS